MEGQAAALAVIEAGAVGFIAAEAADSTVVEEAAAAHRTAAAATAADTLGNEVEASRQLTGPQPVIPGPLSISDFGLSACGQSA